MRAPNDRWVARSLQPPAFECRKVVAYTEAKEVCLDRAKRQHQEAISPRPITHLVSLSDLENLYFVPYHPSSDRGSEDQFLLGSRVFKIAFRRGLVLLGLIRIVYCCSRLEPADIGAPEGNARLYGLRIWKVAVFRQGSGICPHSGVGHWEYSEL